MNTKKIDADVRSAWIHSLICGAVLMIGVFWMFEPSVNSNENYFDYAQHEIVLSHEKCELAQNRSKLDLAPDQAQNNRELIEVCRQYGFLNE